jgi:hypothetical protein
MAFALQMQGHKVHDVLFVVHHQDSANMLGIVAAMHLT